MSDYNFKSPRDARMWTGLGSIYELQQRYKDAVMCFKRACNEDQGEGGTIARLAKCYENVDLEMASVYWKYVYEKCRGEGGEGELSFLNACLFLGKKCVREKDVGGAVRLLFVLFIYFRGDISCRLMRMMR